MKGAAGVSDVLRSDGQVAHLVAQYVCRSEVAGLDVLVSGPRRPNPSELLASARFADLLAWAETQYDQILVDSPPVLAASDAQILGRFVDGVLLVVQPDCNRRRIVERAVESFSTLGVTVLGVVANQIRPELSEHYDDGYAYGYGDTYGDEAELDGSVGVDQDPLEQAAATPAQPSPADATAAAPLRTKRVA
jgi:capsular exopolysaccharide synthesis family protein